MSALDDVNARLDDIVERTSQSLEAMRCGGIRYPDAVASLIGSFLATSQRTEHHAEAATHYAVLLVRAVHDRSRIRQLEEQLAMHQAVLANLDGLAEL